MSSQRDPEKVLKFRNSFIVLIALAVVQILATVARIGKPIEFGDSSMGTRLTTSILSLLVLIYMFICIDSLRQNLEDEKRQSVNPIVMVQASPCVTFHPAHHPHSHYADGQLPVYHTAT